MKEALSQKYGVQVFCQPQTHIRPLPTHTHTHTTRPRPQSQGIPMPVVLNGKGELVTTQGRGEVGKYFKGWTPAASGGTKGGCTVS